MHVKYNFLFQSFDYNENVSSFVFVSNSREFNNQRFKELIIIGRLRKLIYLPLNYNST